MSALHCPCVYVCTIGLAADWLLSHFSVVVSGLPSLSTLFLLSTLCLPHYLSSLSHPDPHNPDPSLSGVMLDASVMMEVLTPLFPSLFLPMASVANIGMR